ncbi:hypothetical protein M3Y94_00937100 [Aphelenchoides besseyi]|nr:hypothetical protein M3Y94_00937100 [Aphelenchoides besseyi]KAI6224938.1 Transcriptional activator protein Pur-beta-like isoform X1 [Aphelenchoides besseyi]
MSKSSESGTSINGNEAEANGHDEASKRGVEIASRSVVVDKKRFYIDLKENDRGRFLQFTSLAGQRKNRLYMTLSIAKKIVACLDKNVEVTEEDAPKTIGRMTSGKRLYFVDLRKNDHGAFLRLTQTFNRAPVRHMIYIPIAGIADLRSTLKGLVDEYGTDEDEEQEVKLPPPHNMRDVRNKIFYFDCNANDFGDYLRITETRFSSDNRTSLTVSLKNLPRFHEILGEILEQFRECRNITGDEEQNEEQEVTES